MKKYFLLLFLVLLCKQVLAEDKVVVAHRGASGYLPEHSLETKVLAFTMNVPYIEQDVVMSKDNELIVIHDLYLDTTSDVAKKFPNRKRKDGHYYVIDFTLPELRTLEMSSSFVVEKGKEKPQYPQRFPIHKSYFTIHTLKEEIELIQGLNTIFNKNIGIYVEVKAPWFHKQEGRDISLKTLEVLKQYGYTKKSDAVYFQSFDYPDLVRVKKELFAKLGIDLKLIALIGLNEWKETYEFKDNKWQEYDFSYLLDKQNYAEISKIADVLAPPFALLFDENSLKQNKIKANDFVKNAHSFGMKVHTFTLRKDSVPAYVNNFDELLKAVYFTAGVDGAFSDFPDLALEFLEKNK